MTRIFGVDVSKFQSPNAPAGVSWDTIREKSSFVIVRMSYGTYADPQAVAHIRAARAKGFQVGGYHFFVASQPVTAQLDTFCAQAVRCGIGKGDIVPALDIEDDGKNLVVPAWEPLVRHACDYLVAEFGSAMPYVTQRDWNRLGAPAWLLDFPLWTANYTNAAKPATPGNRPCAIWQNRVGPYNPGAPFVASEAYLSNAIDQNVADSPLPLATTNPTMPSSPAAPPIDPPSQPDVWKQRVDALNLAAGLEAGLDLSHDDESAEGMGV